MIPFSPPQPSDRSGPEAAPSVETELRLVMQLLLFVAIRKQLVCSLICHRLWKITFNVGHLTRGVRNLMSVQNCLRFLFLPETSIINKVYVFICIISSFGASKRVRKMHEINPFVNIFKM